MLKPSVSTPTYTKMRNYARSGSQITITKQNTLIRRAIPPFTMVSTPTNKNLLETYPKTASRMKLKREFTWSVRLGVLNSNKLERSVVQKKNSALSRKKVSPKLNESLKFFFRLRLRNHLRNRWNNSLNHRNVSHPNTTCTEKDHEYHSLSIRFVRILHKDRIVRGPNSSTSIELSF